MILWTAWNYKPENRSTLRYEARTQRRTTRSMATFKHEPESEAGMRILKNNLKVYGYDELLPEAQKTAQKYINNQKYCRKEYHFTVNDFEWYADGKIMFYTHNINAF